MFPPANVPLRRLPLVVRAAQFGETLVWTYTHIIN